MDIELMRAVKKLRRVEISQWVFAHDVIIITGKKEDSQDA